MEVLMQKVLSTMRKAIEKYKLIEDGDKIAVGVSGGKDSLVMLKALNDFKKFGLYDFEIIAVNSSAYIHMVAPTAIEGTFPPAVLFGGAVVC